jgi:hypothetical protein
VKLYESMRDDPRPLVIAVANTTGIKDINVAECASETGGLTEQIALDVILMERTVSSLFVLSGDTAHKLSAEGNQ